MIDPIRLRDEPHSALELSLLEAGRSYTASVATRGRVLSALGVVAVATSSSAAAASLSKASLAKWAVAATLVGGGAIMAARYAALAPSVPSSAHVAGAVVQQAPTPSHVAVDPGSAPVATESSNKSPFDVVSTPRIEPKAAPPALAAELSALDAARASLRAGDPKSALNALDAYARTFPRGRLGLEAEVLRIDALAQSGQTAAARTRAEAFIKRHPDSVLASRVRGYVGL